MMEKQINTLFTSQLKVWKLARENYEALRNVKLKTMKFQSGEELKVQFNPLRIISAMAKVDKKSLEQRPCFLCKKNRPEEQEGLLIAKEFILLVNPFPILQEHFTIANLEHTPQRIVPYLAQMLDITKQLDRRYTIFYNGGKCGASAPDHMHFQAGLSEQFPIWQILEQSLQEKMIERDGVVVKSFENYAKAIVIEGKELERVEEFLLRFIALLAEFQPQEDEPMLNVLSKYEKGWKVIVFPREKHRPSQYFAEGAEQLLLSPASVEFGGLLAVPRKEDFERIDSTILEDVFRQLCLNNSDFSQLKEKIKQLCY